MLVRSNVEIVNVDPNDLNYSYEWNDLNDPSDPSDPNNPNNRKNPNDLSDPVDWMTGSFADD